MRKPQLAAIALTAAAGIALTGSFAGTAFASTVAPSQTAPAVTPVQASPTPTTSPSSTAGLNVSGKISDVDLAKGTITVTITVNGKDVSIKLNIPKTTKVVVNGVQTTLANLPVGAKVTATSTNGALTLNASTDTTKLASLVGSLVAVDAKAGTVKVNLPSGVAQTLPVAADAKITLDGANVSLAGLPVNAKLNVVTKDLGKGQVVTSIEAKRAVTATPTATATAKPVVTPTTKPVVTPTATTKPTVKVSAVVK